MSLFEDSRYRYRETCFVLFRRSDKPSFDAMIKALSSLGDRYQLSEPRKTTENEFDAVTIRCPFDHAAMDITSLEGEPVLEQLDELRDELHSLSLSEADLSRLQNLEKFDARLDVFHFEELSPDDEDSHMDPGALLVVLQTLTELTGGIGVDPQSGTLL